MQVTSQLTATVQKLLAARSGFAGPAQPVTFKPTTTFQTEPPLGRPGVNSVEVEGEYNQFGRFETPPHDPAAIRAMERAKAVSASSTEIVRTTTPEDPFLREGKATVGELEEEYARFISAMVMADREGGPTTAKRNFIPAGMTEESVNALADYEYMWAVEDGKRATLRSAAEWQEGHHASLAEQTIGDSRRGASDTLYYLQKALPQLNDSAYLASPEYLEKRKEDFPTEEAFQSRVDQSTSRFKHMLRYVNKMVQGLSSDHLSIRGDLLVQDENGKFQLGKFDIYFKDQHMLSSSEAPKPLWAA
jgi:hypothetical protein